MGSEQGDAWAPQSRVGAVVVALVQGDQAAAERAAGLPPDERDPSVLRAAIRLAVRSLFDEDTGPEQIAEFVAAMREDVELDPAVAAALIRAQRGEPELLEAFAPQSVDDTTWSTLGYLCERRLGPEDSLQLVEYAEQQALHAA
jgi:hypothetical protein